MNKYFKEFLKRGAMFAVLGPIISGFIFCMIEVSGVTLDLHGWQIFLAIFTTSLLAFIHAGTSVFHQIESWSPIKSALLQCVLLYVAYICVYLANTWIPLKWEVILIFTAAFIACYFIIWLIVYLVTRKIANKMNQNLKK